MKMTLNAPGNNSPVRYTGLDGLRALAVLLVVTYHLFPPSFLPGGFIGVDVFFVISGFLITSLLLGEQASSGRIRLGDFWRRRVRRLLPALAIVVTVCATAAWIIGGDVLVNLGAQVIGAFTFSYNWVSIADQTGYFSSGSPELFRNFWSLAVEEQFYVVWPLVLPLFLLLPRAWWRASAAIGIALASAAAMRAVVDSGGSLTRAYFGTDTHAFGILLGVALAFVLAPALRRRALGLPAAAPAVSLVPAAPVTSVAPPVVLPPGWTIVYPKSASPAPAVSERASRTDWMLRPTVRAAVSVLGIIAVAGIIGLAAMPPIESGVSFPGALLAASALSVIAIMAGVWPRSGFGRAIDLQPLRWIGERSYGIYLWHWPLLVLAMAAFDGAARDAGVPLAISLGVLLLTFVAAAVSYRFVETPIRRLGFRATVRRMVTQVMSGPRSRLRALGVSVAAVVVIFGTTAGIVAAPDTTSSEAAVAAGQSALEQARRDAAASPSPSTTATATPAPTAPAPPPKTAADPADPTPMASPVPSPENIRGDEISAVGDSVMLASAGGLLDRFPGIQIDAAVSRSMWAGPGILENLADSGHLRRYVVIALGTNGPVNEPSLEAMVRIAGPHRTVVLVTAFAPRDWIAGVNADLAAFAKAHPGVVVSDWSRAIAKHTDLLAGDSIHPGAAGGRIFAETVAATLDAVESRRAQRQYESELKRYESERLDPPPLPR
jgi:peptidoglycan/LPS O-acetylase OafA/YrhL